MENETIQTAIAHHSAGRAAEAEEICRRLLQQRPDDHAALNFLAAIRAEKGKIDEAISLAKRAVAACPRSAVYQSNLGEYYRQAADFPRAIEHQRLAVGLNPKMAAAQRNLGAALDDAGQFYEAIQAHLAAIGLAPQIAEGHYNLGNSLLRIGDHQSAAHAFGEAVRLKPNFPQAYYNLGMAHFGAGKIREAIEAYSTALALKKDYTEAANNLGLALESMDRHEEAIAVYERSLSFRPDNAQTLANLGSALLQAGRLEEASAAFEKAIGLAPDFADGHWNLALSELLRGNYERGWAEYEWRWRIKSSVPSPHRSVAAWKGEGLEGKTILIYAEQGFGDTIQFARFLPLVAARGGRIVFECQVELQRLFSGVGGIWQTVARGKKLPEFEVQCPLMSVPGVLGLGKPVPVSRRPTQPSAGVPGEGEKSAIAAGSYIRPPFAFSARWKSGPRIGLVWAGSPTQANDRRRSIALEMLAPLARFRDVHFYSLQKGAAGKQKPPEGLNLIDWTQRLTDFADTAAMIDQMDLVVGVDTAVMHLAGAMGKAAWVLLPVVPPWHYGMVGDTSPWYPTLRLFRQKRGGDWRTPIWQLVEALDEWLATYEARRNA